MPCAKGMRGCRRDCLHRKMVEEYRDAHLSREMQRESSQTAPTSVPGTVGTDVAMWQLEADEFRQHVPPILFKDWLIEHKKPREE
jgi:hypothetical protein